MTHTRSHVPSSLITGNTWLGKVDRILTTCVCFTYAHCKAYNVIFVGQFFREILRGQKSKNSWLIFVTSIGIIYSSHVVWHFDWASKRMPVEHLILECLHSSTNAMNAVVRYLRLLHLQWEPHLLCTSLFFSAITPRGCFPELGLETCHQQAVVWIFSGH